MNHGTTHRGNVTKPRTLAAGALAAVLSATLLTACGNNDDTSAGTATDTAATSTANSAAANTTSSAAALVDNPAEAPQRIVAVTNDVAQILLSLTGGDRVVAVPASAKAETAGPTAGAARTIEGTLPPGTDPEVEQVLTYEPDLVIATARHGGEKTFTDQLLATGVETLLFDSSTFTTPEGIAEATLEIGAAIGLEKTAAEQAEAFTNEIAEVDALATSTAPTTALALMTRGPQIMAMDSKLMLPTLTQRAGATYAADSIGISNTAPIDAELLLKANPDIIFLENFQGGGVEAFQSLLSNPAVAEVPAIKQQRIVLVEMAEASATSGLNTAVGYRKIVEALQTSAADN